MSSKKAEVLASKYPQWLEPYDLGIGDGWIGLVEQICVEISKYPCPDIKFAQIKEKFGGLRVYVDNIPSDEPVYSNIQNSIDFAEQQSYKTCESCGSMNNVEMLGSGWIKTLCVSCRNQG